MATSELMNNNIKPYWQPITFTWKRRKDGRLVSKLRTKKR